MPTKTDTLQHDLGALLLRLTVGGLMLFHGADKMAHGIGWMGSALAAKGLKSFTACVASRARPPSPLS